MMMKKYKSIIDIKTERMFRMFDPIKHAIYIDNLKKLGDMKIVIKKSNGN